MPDHEVPVLMMKTPCSLRLAGALLAGLTGFSLSAAGEALVRAEFIFDSATYPKLHGPSLAETPRGLVAAWFGGTREKNPDVGIWVSRLEGGRWTTSVEVANSIQFRRPDGTVHRHPTWNPVLFQPRPGPLLLSCKVGPTPETWWAC